MKYIFTDKSLFKEETHHKIYVFLLFIILISISQSRISLSISQILLFLNWILSGNFKKKFDVLKKNKDVFIFSGIYMISVLFFINTSDINTGLEDLKLKLPFLAFPLIIASSGTISNKLFKYLIIFFSLSIVVKAGITYFFYFSTEANRLSEAVYEISYIRLSVFSLISGFYLLYFLFTDFFNNKLKIKEALFFISTFIFLSFFVLFLKSFTGTGLWILLFIGLVIILAHKSKKQNLKNIIFFSGIIFISIVTIYISYTIIKYNKTEEYLNINQKLTLSGNSYDKSDKNTDKENGYSVSEYICAKELKENWNKISKYKYSGKDKKDQEIKYTLIRYLTSKGLRKDKEGIEALSKNDIRNIKNGMSNYIFENNFSFYSRLYVLYWQIEQYNKGKNPAGHSITQRLEFIKNGVQIIKQNFWFGVGTGDLESEFSEQYKLSNSRLPAKYRLKPHNQFITYFVCFGVFGFLYIIFAVFYPIFYKKKYKNIKFLLFFIPFFISLFNEDGLEVQIGITFFAVFYSLLMWGNKKICR